MRSGRYYLTAQQAADALGVKRSTLYAYASRGQLRSESNPDCPRERYYYRDDIARLSERKEERRDPAKAAARSLHWGGPVLESGVTLIHNGRCYYRGQDAVTLAATAGVEQVAALLWDAKDGEQERLFKQHPAVTHRQLAPLHARIRDPITSMQAALPIAAAVDLAAYDLSAPAVRKAGARIIRLLTMLVAQRETARPVHRALQMKWTPRQQAVADVIRTAMVLCADHELNVSAFTARCAASAGASPYDVVSAAMATFRGHKHGGASERVMALLAEVHKPGAARLVVASRLRRGERLPGFGHPLYPDGDPRAALLLRLVDASGNDVERQRIREFLKAAADLAGDLPNLDFGLAAVTRAYRLPDHAPVVVFALGRTVGWIAHAIEEYASGQLIRPRARYTGPAPPEGGPPLKR